MTPELYVKIYYYTLLVIVLFFSLFSRNQENRPLRFYALLLFVFVFCMITFRDLDPIFGDTKYYAFKFEQYVQWGIKEMEMGKIKDIGFEWFTLFWSMFDNLTLYFGAIALVYLLPVYLAFEKGFKDSVFIVLLLFICSFSFWGYGVNGLRNGMATSLIVAAMFSNRMWLQILLIIIASSFHVSALLPGLMFLIAKYYHNPKTYLIIYGIFLLISITVGEQLGSIIGNWDLISGTDERLQGYLTTNMETELDNGLSSATAFSRVGFRWDFVLYSLIPILLGYIYIYRQNYNDKLYKVLYCTYVGCNAFWLLTIYVPFNNRFAYLSWFIYSVIISYPLLKEQNFVDFQKEKIQVMVLLNYAFTFFMFIR